MTFQDLRKAIIASRDRLARKRYVRSIDYFDIFKGLPFWHYWDGSVDSRDHKESINDDDDQA